MDLPDKTQPTPEPKAITPVIPKGSAKQSPRPATRRFFDYMFAESPKHLVGKIVGDVFVPRVKAGLEESLNHFLHGMFWGNGSAPTSPVVRGTVLRGGGVVLNGTNYNELSTRAAVAGAVSSSPTGPYQDLIVHSQQYAEALLGNMIDLLNRYRVVTVADLYESASITPEDHHNNLGWYGLDGARITKERDGYRLALPKPVRV